MRHAIASIILTVGFFSATPVFLHISFLELEPAYQCSHYQNMTAPFKCFPKPKKDDKDNTPTFCG